MQVKEGLVMRDFNFAVIDEVDSILIDEARTPLIISGVAGNHGQPIPKSIFAKEMCSRLVLSQKWIRQISMIIR